MDTAVRTPLDIFNLPQLLVVPLFQRPYVWSEEKQWEPLWDDLRRLTEYKLTHPTDSLTHFLGAIVLQSIDGRTGDMSGRAVIDGQQRLTTLQLLFDAASAAIEERGLRGYKKLQALTHNDRDYVDDEEDRLKLQHTNDDRQAFGEVMDAVAPIDYESLKYSRSRLAGAHRFFYQQIGEWLDNSEVDDLAERAAALTVSISRGLQLVVIDLRADENSQEIFETLNARGTPLTAADLIKNLVFQRLQAEHADVVRSHVQRWPFDTPHWQREVRSGGVTISRSSLFFNHWLVSRLGEEVGTTSTFTRFKRFVEVEADMPMSELLDEITQQASRYAEWSERAADPHAALSRVELCVYRTEAANVETIKSILLWLHHPASQRRQSVIDAIVSMVESWYLRRAFLRLSLTQLPRVISDVIRIHRSCSDDELSFKVEEFLAGQDSEGAYWPGDAELRAGLRDTPVYQRLRRPRLRMLLEAVEDDLRGFNGTTPSRTGARVERAGRPIEHLLPQAWQEHWPVPDLAAQISRDDHVHRLGNLTLITQSLNSVVSNAAWLGPRGKREMLRDHDVYLVNRVVYDTSADGWTEALIDQRTEAMLDAVARTWPTPAGHRDDQALTTGGSDDGGWISLQALVASGHLEVGTCLRPIQGQWQDQEAIVQGDGSLMVNGRLYGSPSAAGKAVRQKNTNGWYFWHLPDGRPLTSVRAVFRQQEASEGSDT